MYYILKDKVPVQVHDMEEWMDAFRLHDSRIVAKTDLPDDIQVSTVFLGMDHSFGDDGPPILFETMIFGGALDGYQERYSTWEEAEEGHRLALELIHEQSIEDLI
jgi:hypothetical protein